jgi:hypothetical protein
MTLNLDRLLSQGGVVIESSFPQQVYFTRGELIIVYEDTGGNNYDLRNVMTEREWNRERVEAEVRAMGLDELAEWATTLPERQPINIQDSQRQLNESFIRG